MNKKPTIDIITLGCSKNLVDSETLMGLFESRGYHVTHDAENPQGEIAIVNLSRMPSRRVLILFWNWYRPRRRADWNESM